MAEAPTHFLVTANAADPAVQISTTDLFGRKIVMTGYPVSATTNIYIGYNSSVSASNFAEAIRGGDRICDEAQNRADRRNAKIFWMKVEADGTGVMVGVE